MTIRNKDAAPRFYESKGSVAHFVGQITTLITEYGSDAFQVENRNGGPVAISFSLGGLAYRIRPDVAAMEERLERSRPKGKAAADVVAWAQARHLLELQLEAIETGAARASEVLGGYVLTAAGRTVGEMIDERAEEFLPGERLLLPGGTS